MHAIVRNQLARGKAALAFASTTPTTDPGVQLLVGQLTSALGDGEALTRARGEADNQAQISRVLREQLKSRLRRTLLRALSQAGLAAAEDNAALLEEFSPISPRLSAIEFLAAARSLAAAARTNLDVLLPFGVTQATVDETDQLIAELAGLDTRAAEGRRVRAQARLDLDRAGHRVMDLVTRLDALYRHQFATDPTRTEAWILAVGSSGPIRRNSRRPEAEGQATDPVADAGTGGPAGLLPAPADAPAPPADPAGGELAA
ncbi:MAG: hypothetical protein AB7L66_08630 [Gemmatimonadales bacterium]